MIYSSNSAYLRTEWEPKKVGIEGLVHGDFFSMEADSRLLVAVGEPRKQDDDDWEIECAEISDDQAALLDTRGGDRGIWIEEGDFLVEGEKCWVPLSFLLEWEKARDD